MMQALRQPESFNTNLQLRPLFLNFPEYWFQDLKDTKTLGYSHIQSARYLHRTYAQPPAHCKSALASF
jgi:hypothetical protein